MVKNSLLLIVLFVASSLQAQTNRYMVFFTDKTGSPHEVSTPTTFLSDRAIQRRIAQGIEINDQDIPISPVYVQGLRDIGITVLYSTKWMNGVLIECTAAETSAIQTLPYVTEVEYVAPDGRPPVGGRIRTSAKFKEESGMAAVTDLQLSMHGMDIMHQAGYRGEGMLIAIMDAGFPGANTAQYFTHVFNEGRFNAATSYDFVHGTSNVFQHNAHGTNVWSTMAGYKDGEFVGGAYKASYILFVTEHAPTEYRVEEYNWLFAAERADSAGVDVINTSLGYSTFDDASFNYNQNDMDGETAVITRASSIAASKGMAVVVSAGNEGAKPWQIITAPADGKDVLAVGAVDALGAKASFSSIGPSADGRIKPDVAAMGVGVSIIGSGGNIGTSQGTSFAGPLTASLVAGVWQKFPELTAQQLLDTIRFGATRFSNPDNSLGYGIPQFQSFITSVNPEAHDPFVIVYPNPAYEEVLLEFTDAQYATGTVTLVDSRGVAASPMVNRKDDTRYSLKLTGCRPGLYILRIQWGKQFQTHKILKIE